MLFVWLGISESIYNVHMRVKAVKKYAKHTKLSQNYVAGEKSEHANICVNNFIVCSCKWTGVTFGRKKHADKKRKCAIFQVYPNSMYTFLEFMLVKFIANQNL